MSEGVCFSMPACAVTGQPLFPNENKSALDAAAAAAAAVLHKPKVPSRDVYLPISRGLRLLKKEGKNGEIPVFLLLGSALLLLLEHAGRGLHVYRSNDGPDLHREGAGPVSEGIHKSRGVQTSCGQRLGQ
ncbi:hypothetical protein JOB18_048940 [Solea senegalensis]|uniref:Uncharacterized protein n=1 Tax=Solea senegalensis TaxID=28829 RepID=A0AAV6SJ43_SOLSE|nr:hypothetical protein JOB18_048940 [Solea senegalensis]